MSVGIRSMPTMQGVRCWTKRAPLGSEAEALVAAKYARNRSGLCDVTTADGGTWWA